MKYKLQNDPILNPAFEYWRKTRGARLMPRRSEIDPVEIPPRLLPHLQITEIVDGGARYRYRLAGTAIVDAYGAELTGKYYDEVFSGDRLRYIEANFRLICLEKRPIFVRNQYHSARGAFLVCSRVVMPLSDDDVNVHQFLMAMSFQHPGAAYQWAGAWIGNDGTFDFANSYMETIE